MVTIGRIKLVMLKLLFMVVLVMLWLFAPIGIVESCADKKYGVTIVCSAIFFMGIILIFVL